MNQASRPSSTSLAEVIATHKWPLKDYPGGQVHELKADPVPFDDVAAGLKTHEVRFNDRNFRVGDVIVLCRTRYSGRAMQAGMPLEYSGRELVFVVTHVLSGYGLLSGWVILSIRDPVDMT